MDIQSRLSEDVISNRPYLFLGSRLKRLAEQMQSDIALTSQQASLPVQPGQYPLLVVLAEKGAKTIGELAQSLRLSQPAITKHVSKLVASGLVSIDQNGADRRLRTVSLSPLGQEVLERSERLVWPLVEAAVKAVVGELSGSFLAQIAEIEDRLVVRNLGERVQEMAIATLARATETDIPAIVSLMNRAYRGSGTGAGWTTEAAYIDGDRTSEAVLRQEMIAKTEATLLVWRRAAGDLQGCVWLEHLSNDTWYLGSLTVEPLMQNGGFGRQLLSAAEQWVHQQGGKEVRMTVVNVRDSLIAWYMRRGYQLTGETEVFPYADARFGTPKRPDLWFIVLQKQLSD